MPPTKNPTNPSTPEDRLSALADYVLAEATAIKELIPGLVDAQWSKAKPPSRRRWEVGEPEDAGIRSKGAPPADPTGDAAVCPHRLRVRDELRLGEGHLLKAAALVKGARASMERALDRWEGDRD